MVISRKVELNYYEQGDTLWIHLDADSAAQEAITEYDFYVRYNRDNPSEIVGFKVLDFSHFVSHMDEEGVLPQLPMSFDAPELFLKSANLRELLDKAYSEFVLSRKQAPRKVAL